MASRKKRAKRARAAAPHKPGRVAGARKSSHQAASRRKSALATMAGMTAVPKPPETNTFGREQLIRQRIDDLGQGYVSMAAELWIVKDRLAVLEEVLARHGIPAPSAVDRFEPEGEFKSRLDAQRREWTRRIIGALFPRGLPQAD